MFVTKELNAITQLFQDGEVSQAVQEQLHLDYVNLEATLLRGKVLRDFSKEKVAYIVQAKIEENDNNLGYLFAPFIIAKFKSARDLYNTDFNRCFGDPESILSG